MVIFVFVEAPTLVSGMFGFTLAATRFVLFFVGRAVLATNGWQIQQVTPRF